LFNDHAWAIEINQKFLCSSMIARSVRILVILKVILKVSLKTKSELTWSEYIEEQAYYILVSRPNNPIGNCKIIYAVKFLWKDY